MNEHNTQRLIVAWFRCNFPHLEHLFFAIPNGGKRDPVTAKRMKDEGVLPGVPDLMLAVPVAPYHGLFVEMKRATRGTASEAQESIHKALQSQGYAVALAHGYEAAKAAIGGYLQETTTT